MSESCCSPASGSKCPMGGKMIKPFILAIALIFSAMTIADGLKQFRSAERIVTVKGLATQDVEADIAVWPIKHVVTGDDLAYLQAQIEKNSAKIKEFLLSKGITGSDIINRKLEVYDKLAQAYGENNIQSNRYILSETITVNTKNLDAMDKALESTGNLIKDGITLVRDMDPAGPGNPTYIYTKLNEIKPTMISTATKNARTSAEQFATDSGARVGRIAQADQGMFIILPRNSDNSYIERAERYKTVRVVSTLKFYIE